MPASAQGDAADPGRPGLAPGPEASRCFGFEVDFVAGWRCIPLCLRRKLDLAGIKLKLGHWIELSRSERQELVDWPDDAAALNAMALHLRERSTGMANGRVKDLPVATGEPWSGGVLPDAVQQGAVACGRPISPAQWTALSELERFALCKLARPGHDHHNLPRALAEFLD